MIENQNSSQATEIHLWVDKCISEINVFNKTIIFPGAEQDPKLSSDDYKQFLLQISDICISKEKIFEQFILSHADTEALDGFIAYDRDTLPFSTLTIQIKEKEKTDNYLSKLKNLFLSLSGKGVKSIIIQEEPKEICLNILDIEKLTLFIEKSNKISLTITLPEPYNHTNVQKRIDQACSSYIRDKTIIDFSKRFPERSAHNEIQLTTNKVKRTRPRLSNKNVSFDIEMEQQQEQQSEMAIESNSTFDHDNNATTDSNRKDYSLFDFRDKIRCKKFPEYTPDYIKDPDLLQVNDMWDNWFGIIVPNKERNNLYISEEACRELLIHQQKFNDGVDFNRLPAGFSFISESNFKKVLHFESYKKELAAYDALKVQSGIYTC